MPLYIHKDAQSGKNVEILRSFKEYEEKPTLEEALAAGLTEEEYTAAQWRRVLGSGIKVVRGANWQGSKGNW